MITINILLIIVNMVSIGNHEREREKHLRNEIKIRKNMNG